MNGWFIAQWIGTVGMTGVIWFVQLVHYPAYRWVDDESFPRYQKEHMRRTTWVVFPLMMMELAGALVWAWEALDDPALRIRAWTGLVLVGIIWASTALVQVPLHERLAKGRSPGAIESLIRSNWVRTVAWTLRAGLMITASI